jgi:aminoglycoside 6-adenylyltransferase
MNYSNDLIIQTLIAYAERDDNIRAVLMEGSRAFGMVDEHSDYDIVYVTRNSEPYFDGAILPFLTENFGEITVMQTPDNGNPHDVYTHLVQFASGVRIDLTFNSLDFLSRNPNESATAALLDKDGRFETLPPPSDADFWIKKPTTEVFNQHTNQFWWVSPYVAKACARGQTLHALEILNERVRAEYAVMLSWLAGARNGWECVNTGKHNTNIATLLLSEDTHYYNTLVESYVPADVTRIRAALDALMVKYHALAAVTSDLLGFAYNCAEGERTMAFIKERF